MLKDSVAQIIVHQFKKAVFFFAGKEASHTFGLSPPAGSSSSVDMESAGGELSDSGSSGYWSWDHGNGSPAPSPSVTEMDSSPDEGLQLELEQAEEHTAKRAKVGGYSFVSPDDDAPLVSLCCPPSAAELL